MKEIKKIKSGIFSRQLAVAKLAFKAGSSFYFSDNKDLKERFKDGIEKHLDSVVAELGLMKGSLMKAGQMLSLYSGYFLSPKAQKILKALENQSHFLEWQVMSKRIPLIWKNELNINTIPLAAASLGQVHMAQLITGSDGPFVMKIQYEGVRRAIDNDLRSLRWLLKGLGILPNEINLDEIFLEIREMLEQETDYVLEKKTIETYAKLVSNYPQYEVPKVVAQYSNDSILSTSFLKGVSPRSSEVKSLPQEKRNKLGEDFLRLFFLEIFEWGFIQTDPHFGNYLVMDHENQPHGGLLDFGAIKEPPKEFLLAYQELVISCTELDREKNFNILKKMGYLSTTKESNNELLWEYAQLLGTPFSGGDYDWGSSDIPDQILKFMPKLLREVSVGSPPRHAIFIDRKISGVFFMLKELGAIFDPKKLINEFIKPTGS